MIAELVILSLLASGTFETSANGFEKSVAARADDRMASDEKEIDQNLEALEKSPEAITPTPTARRNLPFNVPTTTLDGKLYYVVSRVGNHGARNQFFNRTWEEYREGFGSEVSGDYWLGLRKMTQLTNGATTARFDLTVMHEPNNRSKNRACTKPRCRQSGLAVAIYRKFRIMDEANQFQLEAGEYDAEASTGVDGLISGSYSEPHTDPVNVITGMKFTTWDRDNDKLPTANCAQHWGCGWWWNACGVTRTTCSARYGTIRWANIPVTAAAVMIGAD